jgi:uncharacterized repeat protein (TIGR02543 family)
MKKKVFIPCLGLLAAFALAFMFTACPNNSGGGDPELTGTVNLANQTVPGTTFRMGDTVKATVNSSNATTFNYQWQKRTGTGAWTNIPSATTDAYAIATPVAAGDSIKVVVTADGFSGTKESNAVTVSAGGTPAFTGTVAIQMGSPLVTVSEVDMNDTVTATVSANAATYTYQWQKRTGTGAWTDIGATSATYTVASPVALGDEIRVVVTSTDTALPGSIESSAVEVVDPDAVELTGSVTVARTGGGTIRINDEVTATITGLNEGATASYQWQRRTGTSGDFSDIPSATSATYTITTPVLANDYIRVFVRAESGFRGHIESDPVQVSAAPILYTVTFDSNGGSAINSVNDVDAGTSLALKEAGDWKAAYLPTKTDKTFLGWYLGTDTTRATIEDVTVSSNITLVAKWNSYTVTLNPDGGSQPSNFMGPIETLSVNDGATLNLFNNFGFPAGWIHTSTKTGFVFDGWYLEGDEDKTPLNSGIVGTRDVTIKAIWLVEVIVTLDPNGGTLSGSTTHPVASGGTFNPYNYTPTNSTAGSDIFYGWYYSTDTTPQVLPRPGTITVTAAVTLKALWGAGTTVTLDPNGGTLATGVVETRRLAPGTTFSTSFTDPTHPDNATGTVFRGWYIGTTYTPGATLYDRIDINSVPVGSTDITLTALWVQGVEVTIELDSGAFSGTVATTYYVAPGTKFRTPSASPTKAGYVYTGWFLNSAFTEQFPGDGHPVTEADLDEGITVYAGWFDEALLTAYSNGTVTYLFAASTGSFRAGYFTNNEIRVITWTPTSVDGKVASIVSGTLTLDGTAYPQVMQKKVPATNAALRGANWIKDGITLNLYDSSSNGSTQVSNASYLNVQLSYVVEGNNLYLLRRVTAPAEGEVVLTIPLVPILDPEDSNVITGYTLTGWTK